MNPNMDLLIRPAIFAPFPHVVAGQSTRYGGVSPAPWHSLNLGKSTDDHPDNVAENRRRFCSALGFTPEDMAWSKQVHGDRLMQVENPGGAEGYDALSTAHSGVLLVVSVADCTPILIYDHRNRAIAAVHAGWRGTAAALVTKTLVRMAEWYGTRGEHCYIYIGACIDAGSFEVGEEVAIHFSDSFKRYDADRKKFFVDLKQSNAVQCLDFGVPDAQIEISPFSTVLHNDRFFSHRKDGGVTGRMLAGLALFDGYNTTI